jgi:hypothetical protein
MGEDKVQKKMASFAPPRISSNSLVVVAIGSFQELVTIVDTCTSEFFWKAIIGTSTNLPVSQSYV